MKSRIRRIIYLVVGWACLILGVIGAFLPLLPTTPFLLVTAYCFAKSSPRLHAAIINHPRFGPPLRDWQENRVIRPRAKITATIVLIATVTLAWIQIPMARFPLQLIPTFACLGAATFILTRKSR